MKRLAVATLLLLMSVASFAAPPQPLGYLGILLGYTHDGVQKPVILGFASSKEDCLEKGKHLVEQNLDAAREAGMVLSVACVPIPPAPSPPPEPKANAPLPPATSL